MRILRLVLLAAACAPAAVDNAGTDGDDGTGGDEDGVGTSTGEEEIPPPVDTYVECGAIPDDGDVIGGVGANALNFPAPCNPRSDVGGSYFCCADDPAASNGELPAYAGKGIVGAGPFFSGQQNGFSSWGVCIDTSQVPIGVGLTETAAPNCPIPCNPTWEPWQKEAVCGTQRSCCQTQEIQAQDCIFDGSTWRPVNGFDIGSGRTLWGLLEHATHQDPEGSVCAEIGLGVGTPVWLNCTQQLSVANQRGFCMALGSGQVCPQDAPTYLDACEQINMGLLPPPV